MVFKIAPSHCKLTITEKKLSLYGPQRQKV